MNPRFPLAPFAALFLCAAPPAAAVIVAGTNGDGLGNATESGLQSYLASQSLPAFPYWDNLLRVSDSSGLYLGLNAGTGRGWVMTAAHVTLLTTGSGSISVAGQAYTVRENHVIQHTDISGTFNTDIRLYAIGGEPGDPALPALPPLPILAGNVLAGDDLLLTGRGRRQQVPSEDTTPPYSWDMDATEPNQLTREMRWGSNHVEIWPVADPNVTFLLTEGSPVPTKKTVSFATIFNDPDVDGTAYEGMVALLDSGGGAFVERDGAWHLAGTNYRVFDGPDGDSAANPSGYGDGGLIAHLPTYGTQITGITGVLIPEPGTTAMAALALAALAARRRRAPAAGPNPGFHRPGQLSSPFSQPVPARS
jgi:MYXO-CTERM domain-containing protein